jgi:ankyrin repeat protein
LLSLGVNPSPRDIQGRTPLHEAAFKGWLPIVQLLLKAGADLRAIDARERTVLHDASRSRNPSDDVARLLLQAGANPDLPDDNGRLPLHYAAKHNKPVIVNEILEMKGSKTAKKEAVNAKDKAGRTPLHVTCRSKWYKESMVEALVEAGASWEDEDDSGKTALDYLPRHKRPEIRSSQPPVQSVAARRKDLRKKAEPSPERPPLTARARSTPIEKITIGPFPSKQG